MTSIDPTSFANTDVAVTTKMNLHWKVDFDTCTISGHVTLTFDIMSDNPNVLTLDTREITIKSISMNGGKELDFNFRDSHAKFGSALDIKLPENLKKGEEIKVDVHYVTSPNASALQWMKAEQTIGREQPYLFSQCQAIHARSIVPCQDTPAVKCCYSAKVTVKEPLVALMSAVSSGQTSDNGMVTYSFEQKVPTPSYLLAIVVGKLESREIGPRSKVWSEPQLVDQAAYEFSQTEDFIKAGEALVGEYVWGRYDLLVLPPTFPFGGMENPCLTFVTPTLLAGDRSLADVVAHEISHSWTGNLVTNKNWEHFWLNEGHTVFLERKIMKSFTSEKNRQFHAHNRLKDLRGSIKTFGPTNPLTNLVPTLTDTDPDDAFSTVPYEKGHSLLFYLEQLLGGPEKFEPFLKSYIDHFKYKSLATDEWKAYLYEYFKDQKDVLDSVEWDSWFFTPGMPHVMPEYDQTMATACTNLADRWANATEFSEFKKSDIEDFTVLQVIDFLGQLVLKDPLTPDHMVAMNKVYGFSDSRNSEIKFRWLRLGIRAKYEPIIDPALHMVTIQGRMKYTRPLYRDLGNWDLSRPRAIETFEKNRPFMHLTTAAMVEKDLRLVKSMET